MFPSQIIGKYNKGPHFTSYTKDVGCYLIHNTYLFSDLNNQDNVGNTPLHVAVEHDSLDAVDFLLRK